MHWLRSAFVGSLVVACCAIQPTQRSVPVVDTKPPVITITEPRVIEVPPVVTVQKKVSRHVLVIGDSEACAVNLYIRKTVKEINEAAHKPLDVVDVACKGGTVVQYWGEQGHFREALKKYPNPDAVVIFLGTNHYWQGTRPPVETILNQIQAPTSCVWVGNTAVKGKRWKINNILREAVQPTCSYFDTEAAGIELPDGVHPSGAGAIKWLKGIWPMIPPKYEEVNE